MFQKEILRQLLVLFSLGLSSITDGFVFGQMSGMIDALHSKNDDLSLTADDISWIASTINITCFCGFAVVGTLTELFGRRRAMSVITTPVIFCWLMLYFGNDKIVLLASRVIVGISYGGILLLIHISIGEYTQPNERALCLNVISCIGSLSGTLLGHILSLVMHWRNVALLGIIPTTASALLPFFWKESPSWLASKGRFHECERAFKALHIPSESSENEFRLLLEMEKSKHSKLKINVHSKFSYPQKVLTAIKKKYFWTTCFIGIVSNIYRVAAGRVLFGTLAISILHGITGSSDILFYTFFVDGFAVLGAVISCIFLRKFKMRPLLFISGILSNLILVLVAFVIYFWPENNPFITWTKVSLLALYFITVTAGPYPVLETLMTEIFPLEIKTFCLLCQAVIAGIIQFLSIKLAPSMFIRIGYHGVFILNAMLIFACLLYLYFNLPETKCKTLQEIEISFTETKLLDNFIESQNENETKLLNNIRLKQNKT